MKKKDKTIRKFLLNETGIEISPFLEHLILTPAKTERINNADLVKIVKEYAPIYQKHRGVLDGPQEMQRISIFEIFLICRLTNKPELQKILEGEKHMLKNERV